jgi:hypothetical protein
MPPPNIETNSSPTRMHPIKPSTRARLQHLADAGQNPRHSQGQNDGNEDREITERIHEDMFDVRGLTFDGKRK